ncbi:uncharacterized protein E0L32_000164 [Thyridium curvatum]|uniref:Uncharacterized protein n=1 Tax=Thyridium curvatum TaxID=1093900 RepID=A0A507BH10_9PEZI|nr:uncharacterized protein E0L32_000164 [Thyridium curvatum]TPX15830.1 hypothetical protein E0L32_000164 [Thyridium curvatum]
MAGLPEKMRALVATAPGTGSVEEIPMPAVQYGSALVKLDASLIHNAAKQAFDAANPFFKMPYPVVPGAHGIGRVVAAGPDAVLIKEGQLVLVASFTRARDDPNVQNLWGVSPLFTPQTIKLYTSLIRNGVYAEYVLSPLENLYVVDEARFLGDPAQGGLGLSIPDLLHLHIDAVVYGGLRSIDLKAGERIIITPGSGFFSMAAVTVALAMGADVVATSRNADFLAALKKLHPRVDTVQTTGDVAADSKALAAFGPVEAVLDMSPPWATGSKVLTSAASTLRQYGRVCLLGGRMDESIPIPHGEILLKSLRIQGQFMYQRDDHFRIIRLAESGLLKLGRAGGYQLAGSFGLDQFQEAYEKSTKGSSWDIFYFKF